MSKDENGSKKSLKKKPLNREEILYLLDLYKSYECLWNVNHEDYKNLHARRAAWQDVAQEMEASVEYCKGKIKNLRHLYLAEKKRIDANLEADPCATNDSTLFYYSNMSFLDEVVSYRAHDETVELKTPDESGKVKNIKKRRMSLYLPEPVEPDFSKENEDDDAEFKVEDDSIIRATESSNDEGNDTPPPIKKTKFSDKSPKAKVVKAKKTVQDSTENMNSTTQTLNGYGHDEPVEKKQIKKVTEVHRPVMQQNGPDNQIEKSKKTFKSPLKKNNSTIDSPAKKSHKNLDVCQDNVETVKAKTKKKSKKLQEDGITEMTIVPKSNLKNEFEETHKNGSLLAEKSGSETVEKERNRIDSVGNEQLNGDVFLAFGKSIGLQLSQLPPQRSTNAMAEIQTLVTRHMISFLTE